MAKPPNLKDRLAVHATPRPTPAAPPPAPAPVPAPPTEPAPAAEAEPKDQPKPRSPARAAAPAAAVKTSRVGKVQVAGYFTTEMATALRILAAERRTTVQALMGEGFDLVLRQYGKHPFGER